MTKYGKHCDKRRNCTFCAISSFVTTYVFKKPSAAEASESVYMRERDNCLCLLLKFRNLYFIFTKLGHNVDHENISTKVDFY